jgi:DNA-binding NtrC family response regulator
VANGRFDGQLFHVLAKARVRLLPLRARREDIPALAVQLQHELGCLPPNSATLDLFQKYDWPGNVRELRNALVRSTVLREIGGEPWLPQSRTMVEPVAWSDAASMPYHAAREQVVGDFERAYLVEVLRQANFDLGLASKRTGLSLPSLYRLLKKSGLRLKDLKKDQHINQSSGG